MADSSPLPEDRAASAPPSGFRAEAEAWFPDVYDCLRDLAERWFQEEAPGHTLQPTALVHDVYLRLVQSDAKEFRDRTHFFAVAARALRRILVDHARRKQAVKRGRGWGRVELSDLGVPASAGSSDPALEIVSLDETLSRLARVHARSAQVVELRFFGGLGIDETAEALGVSRGTVKADWRFARAWLIKELDLDEE